MKVELNRRQGRGEVSLHYRGQGKFGRCLGLDISVLDPEQWELD